MQLNRIVPSDPSRRVAVRRWCLRATGAIAASLVAGAVYAQSAPVMPCTAAGIGAVTLVGDGAPVKILSVETATTAAPASVPYCLVKLQIPTAINIWVGLPDKWNNRWQSLGGGGYAGSVGAPTGAVNDGYAGATTDTGHTGGDGSFGMTTTAPLGPNIDLQIDFAYRSEHLMAVLGKQLVQAYYGKQPWYSYWNGCSTGGRQGLRMAQNFPRDYDGILAIAPAIHWDRFIAAEIWAQVVQNLDNGGLIGGGVAATLNAKQALATNAAIAACDMLDGVADQTLTDPRLCGYTASRDPSITKASCTATDVSCLTPTEASAIDKMWQGPVSCQAGLTPGSCAVDDVPTRKLNGGRSKRLWYAQTRGAALNGLGGASPFSIAVSHARYWTYFDPTWDWKSLDYESYVQYFKDAVRVVGPMMASDDPDLSEFRNQGSKLLLWHGFADQLIPSEGTIDYYDALTNRLSGGSYAKTQKWARLFMAPGVAHCGGGTGPQPQNVFPALVSWVEQGKAPNVILASKPLTPSGTQTRPLCPYPKSAKYIGTGDTNNAANFVCAEQ